MIAGRDVRKIRWSGAARSASTARGPSTPGPAPSRAPPPAGRAPWPARTSWRRSADTRRPGSRRHRAAAHHVEMSLRTSLQTRVLVEGRSAEPLTNLVAHLFAELFPARRPFRFRNVEAVEHVEIVEDRVMVAGHGQDAQHATRTRSTSRASVRHRAETSCSIAARRRGTFGRRRIICLVRCPACFDHRYLRSPRSESLGMLP